MLTVISFMPGKRIIIHSMWGDMYMCIICMNMFTSKHVCRVLAKTLGEWIHPYEIKSSLIEITTINCFLAELSES